MNFVSQTKQKCVKDKKTPNHKQKQKQHKIINKIAKQPSKMKQKALTGLNDSHWIKQQFYIFYLTYVSQAKLGVFHISQCLERAVVAVL